MRAAGREAVAVAVVGRARARRWQSLAPLVAVVLSMLLAVGGASGADDWVEAASGAAENENGGGGGARALGRRPSNKINIILSMPDDMGYFDVGFKNPKIYSPNLDFLASNGVQLDRHYMHRFCSPSRSMLLTGKHPFRHGQQTDLNMNPVTSVPCGLQEELTLLPEVFKSAGYATHMLGKWHLGHFAPKFTPTYRGFDTFVGFYAGDSGHMTGAVNKNRKTRILSGRKCTCVAQDSFRVKMVGCSGNKRPLCVTAYQLVNSTAEDGVRRGNPDFITQYDYADELLGDEAARIVYQHDKSDPLFMYLAWISPHSPSQSPERFQAQNPLMKAALDTARCDHKLRLTYAGMISALDKQQGKVIAALKDRGMWDNTLFVFIADNGGHDNSMRKKSSLTCRNAGAELMKSGRNWPLRGGKFTFWEGGIRTLGVVYSPNPSILPAALRGTRFTGLVSGVDWSQTLLEAAEIDVGAHAPADFADDGQSFWPELTGGLPGARQNLPVQVFKHMQRYVYLYQDAASGNLYKYVRGYPGYIRDWGWAHDDSAIIRNDLGDTIQVPEELAPDDPQYDAAIVRRSKTYFKCNKNICLFDLTNDPSERYDLNLRPSPDIVELRTRIADELMRVHAPNEVEFVGSDLCFPGDPAAQLVMKAIEWHDPHAIAVAKVCDSFLSWFQPNNRGKTALAQDQCPPMVALGHKPSDAPTASPVASPSASPSAAPTVAPTTGVPTAAPTTGAPTAAPTPRPTKRRKRRKTKAPRPTPHPSPSPVVTPKPTESPTTAPSSSPSDSPSATPTGAPTETPSAAPTAAPTGRPSQSPLPDGVTHSPTPAPSAAPVTVSPTGAPSTAPSDAPSSSPSTTPSAAPTDAPIVDPCGDLTIKARNQGIRAKGDFRLVCEENSACMLGTEKSEFACFSQFLCHSWNFVGKTRIAGCSMAPSSLGCQVYQRWCV